MFETAELGRTCDKETYEKLVPELRMNLLRVQNELKGADFPVLLLINGVDGAGKGETANILHEWMDPRYLETHAFGPPSDEEVERPDFWRFWRVLPPKGRIGIFFGSWYSDPIIHRVDENTGEAELDESLERINTLEKQLVDDGALLLKFWFHLSKKAQKKRLKSLESDPQLRWRVTKTDWKRFKLYDAYYRVCTRVLRSTSTGEAPWTIIEGYDPRYRYLTVGQQILEQVSRRLAQPKPPFRTAKATPASESTQPTILGTLDLSQRLEKRTYEKELEKCQRKLSHLSRKAVAERMSSILVFEGWDAAGKGGAIRRVTAALDARLYRVTSIAAPTDEEKAHHYLWRFWRHLPRAGRITIFDRSWYGRVLVERVEGFAREEEWKRAYEEINNFEEQLCEHGIVLLKFWMHISRDEQWRRFKERETTPYKQYKITPEDYRNRRRWRDYEAAVNEMVERTSTEYAPWHLIEANDKWFGRIRILRTFCNALAKVL